MNILALDTSTKRISIAYKNETNVVSVTFEGKDKHGRNIGILAKYLKEIGVNFSTLDVIGVGIGPGSLTGLRVGISLALGLAVEKKIVSVPSTKLIAANLMYCSKNIVVARKARQGYLYGAVYDENLDEIISPFIETIEGFKRKVSFLKDAIVVGDGADLLFEYEKAEEFLSFPDPLRMLNIVEDEIKNQNFVEKLNPLYLQKSIAELNFEKRKGGRVEKT
ncbi:tRNA (adenosine(37)-N6)-threonylcarbamoyltransferase complex dimerization subunit type 1 TsaB [Thermosipho ferrireducens]|uniref:tRNA (Adenosine(37)-N6)-threonylcarbamoyltransferase complex dimerization subunit type 1 TsaB n=1 Tax=Thermosipho ferrireducens TaxID=2571116 RepID=A0ABX7SAN1_9BACT|nr:tRNA (adenosine(37)-N6)-threonylcarbamoyltransferase complex dimerization subunit type 1 TsaB [Thermosipho ferrireducens]QTA38355.1 tRNA (adenosine(37)-N6)-threonylcarbamoyltransferase complex dimerization subunit type 1 TsaB [Thermosipho ferrireducens]